MKIQLIQTFIDILRGKKNIKNVLYNINLKKYFSDKQISYINYTIAKFANSDFKIIKTENNYLVFSNNKIQCIIDADYPWIFIEIFGDEIYKFKKDIDSSKKYTVFDIGANRGYASLYFAQKDYVKDIYAFELVPQTFEFLQKNIDLNPKYKDKIHPYCFGLGKEDCEIIYYSDGRDYAISMCKEAILKTNNNIENIKEQKAKIKKTSNVLKQIIEENSIENIILKIDVEGAEYDIFDDLVENYPEIFDKIVKIVGETHLGFDKFYEKIENYGFEVIWSEPHENGTCLFELCKRGIIQ